VIANRALKARLAQIEQFSEDGLPYQGLDMSSTTELFGLYLPSPNPLTVNDLVHLKLIAISLNNHFNGHQAETSKRHEFKDAFNQIYRLLLSMSYVPTLQQFQEQNKAQSKRSQRQVTNQLEMVKSHERKVGLVGNYIQTVTAGISYWKGL
jgi:hypothetical protein